MCVWAPAQVKGRDLAGNVCFEMISLTNDMSPEVEMTCVGLRLRLSKRFDAVGFTQRETEDLVGQLC